MSFTTDVFAPAIRTSRQLGAIGVALNAGFLEAAEVARFGSIRRVHQFKTPEVGLSAGQRDAARGEAVKAVIALCVKQGKPLALEALDFQAKKQDLRVRSPGSKRKLSALPYQAIKTLFCARAQDAGVEVLDVNPAYTSVQGWVRYAHTRGWTVHQAAAGVSGH